VSILLLIFDLIKHKEIMTQSEIKTKIIEHDGKVDEILRFIKSRPNLEISVVNKLNKKVDELKFFSSEFKKFVE